MQYFETWPLPHDNVSIEQIDSQQFGCHLDDVNTCSEHYQKGYDEQGNTFLDCNLFLQQPSTPRLLTYRDNNTNVFDTVYSVFVEFGSTHPHKPNK